MHEKSQSGRTEDIIWLLEKLKTVHGPPLYKIQATYLLVARRHPEKAVSSLCTDACFCTYQTVEEANRATRARECRQVSAIRHTEMVAQLSQALW
ncbi:hypothetical protein KSF_090370 [Reticulibacter mediterranei]|uniref:Uncharacterized protein n=1 Tax=Reticulibacter mediterranei TaxID=2778369 RepID=A0A8J3IW83_9CHLR|nr:hypothetical protein KSF_090370 [Reticulibacter mediterranei]